MKYLGVILDQELRFKEQAAYTISKGSKWAMQARRLSRPSSGMPHTYARQLWNAVAVPKMLYAADVWCNPICR
jgi:hypothetical protein